MQVLTDRQLKLQQRTIDIIGKHGKIVLKKDDWYLSCWTNIASGWDNAHWSIRSNSLEFCTLSWAFTIAKLYNAKVVVVYPKGNKP